MNIDNNYNNQLAFQAKFRLNTRIKDGKRLINEIAPIFEEKTKNYPNDVFQISRNSSGSIVEGHTSYHLSSEKIADDFRVSIIEPEIEELMAKYDNETVATKLYKIFKCLKRETVYDRNDRNMDCEIDKATNVILRQKPIINRYKRIQKDEYAKPFETIAARNQAKIDKIKQDKSREENKLVEDLSKITQNDPDLAVIPQSWREVFNFLNG